MWARQARSRWRQPRLFENGQHALWRALLGNARQLIGRDVDPLADVKIIQRQIRQLTGFTDQQAAAKIGQKIGHELPPFGQEEPLGIAIFLAIETAYEFLFVLLSMRLLLLTRENVVRKYDLFSEMPIFAILKCTHCEVLHSLSVPALAHPAPRGMFCRALFAGGSIDALAGEPH